jgi:hypothetical protein
VSVATPGALPLRHFRRHPATVGDRSGEDWLFSAAFAMSPNVALVRCNRARCSGTPTHGDIVCRFRLSATNAATTGDMKEFQRAPSAVFRCRHLHGISVLISAVPLCGHLLDD